MNTTHIRSIFFSGKPIEVMLLSFCILLLSSCGSENVEVPGLSEGEIKYEIDFPEFGSNDFINNMLPQEADGYFDGDKYRIEMNFGMGVVKTTGISNASTKEAWLLLDFFGNKYATKDIPGVVGDELPIFDITEGAVGDKIAGYQCTHITAKDPGGTDEHQVQFTTEIGTKNLYWNTPFKKLDKGMLMDFPFDTYGISMHMKTKEIVSKEVDPKMFELPEDYEIVEQEKFAGLLNELMEGAGLPIK